MLAAVTPPKQAFTPKRKRRVTWERTDRVKAARRLKYGRRETFTVKTGLRSTCHKNGFIDAVNASLQFTSQCFHEASLLLHLFILDRCSRNLPIEKYNLTFFFDCFVAITRLGNKPDKNLHEDLWAVRDELYNPVRSVALPLQDRTGRNVLLHHLAKELETSFKNNISLNFIGRLEKWCKCVVFLTFPGASSERRRTLVKFLLNGISWNQTEIQLPGASEEEEVYLNLFLDHARQGHSNLLPLSEKHIQANYQEYIKWSWSILQDLQQFHYEISLVQEYIRHEGEVVQGPRLRNLLFSLAPKASLKAHHLSLDTLGFEEIIRWSVTNGFQNAMDAIPSVKQAAKETDEVKRARWFEYFDLDQFITHEGSDMGHKFGRYVSTDGCSLSLKMTRLKEDNTTDRDPYHFPESWMENEDSLRLIGIDPGSRDMITGAVQGDCRAEPQTVSFSGRRFYHESFMIKARSWRERQLAAAPNNLRAVISDLPSSRVARVEDLMNYIHSWTPHLVQALGHFGALQHRNMTKKVYSRRQATLVKVCKLITGGQPKEQVVVGFGDASVGHGSCIPRRNQGPVKALIRVLHRFARVVMVDEFRTSRVCSTALLSGDRCESRLRPFRFAGVDGPRQPYPLQICPDCAMIWNRDINASRNILYCLQRLAARLERPSSMRRQAALDIQGILAEEAVLALEDEHIALAHAH